MLTSDKLKTREIILNELVSTLEFIDFLKYEANTPVATILEKEERKKQELLEQYNLLDT